jgi:flavin-dependent dehydrogenase
MNFRRGSNGGDYWAEPSAGTSEPAKLKLTDGSRVAVVGGGPAGSLFSYYLLNLAETAGLDLEVDLYEPRDFLSPTPTACNMCGGIISETLVQNLATDGINLPATVNQRGIEAYVLHMDGRRVRIETPVQEKRIGSVYRGTGPRKLDLEKKTWKSFDGHLQQLAIERGARPIRAKVAEVSWHDGSPGLAVKGGVLEVYDLVTVAVGVNSPALRLFEKHPFDFEPPTTTKTFIREYYLGESVIENRLGNAMHVFLLNIPGLEFAAIVPKLNCATVCLLGDGIDKEVFDRFLDSQEVKSCMPPEWQLGAFECNCSPRMNVRGAARPFGDRVVFIGDSGVTRLYKDGIGAAYRTAKAAARTAVFAGVSSQDFRRNYWPTCKAIRNDNAIGRLVFAVSDQIQKSRLARSAVSRMVIQEQNNPRLAPRMSSVMWDMFTGSATYREIFLRTLHPAFLVRFVTSLMASTFGRSADPSPAAASTALVTAGGDHEQR